MICLIVFLVILFLIFGLNLRQDRIYRKYHKKTLDQISSSPVNSLLTREIDVSAIEERFVPLARLLSFGYNNLSTNNSFDILVDGAAKRDMLIEDLKNAKEYIHMEYFHFGMDEGSRVIKKLIEQKAREGVKVRFLNENIANMPIPNFYYNTMRRHGVEVKNFSAHALLHPLDFLTRLNYRNHRKIVVIDGEIGYTGGMNINDNYFLRWRDTHMRLCGDAVEGLQSVFLDSWLSSGGKLDKPVEAYFKFGEVQANKGSRYSFAGKVVQTVADDPLSLVRTTQEGYRWTFEHAQDYICIQTPYFAPPKPVLEALKQAARRGVDVVLMLPEKPDNPFMIHTNRAYYEECLDAGIRIALREGEFIHSKTFVCDGYLSMIGTANMDYRGMELCYEINTYIYDSEVAATNKEIFSNDLKKCVFLDRAEWKTRPKYKRLIEKFFRLFTPVL